MSTYNNIHLKLQKFIKKFYFNELIKGVEASKNKNDTKSMSAAPVLSVRPAAPGVSPVTLPPPLTVIALKTTLPFKTTE